MRDKSKISFLKINSLIKKALKFSSFLLIAFLLFSGGNVLAAKTINLGTTGDTILLNGSVGVGTTNPKSRLDIGNNSVGIPATTGSSDSMSVLRVGYIDSAWAGGQLDFGTYNSPQSYASWIQARQPGDYSVNRNIVLQPNGGNVGIGTTNPGAKLDVNGDFQANGNLTLGGLGKKRINVDSATFTLPAQGTKAAFLNLAVNSLCKVYMSSSENGFYQPTELYIMRQAGTPVIIRDGIKIHEHSYDVSFSSDTSGNIWMEKVLYSTGRPISVTSVDQLKGTCTVLDGSTTGVGVGYDQSINANAMASTLNAANVSSGSFGANTGGGNYSFPSNVTAERFKGNNSLVLNTYATVNPASNVFLYSQPNDRDSWIYLDSADTGSNWGIYHRQIDSAVSSLPANSIGFVGGGASALQASISLANGNAYFAGSVGIGTTGPGSKFSILKNSTVNNENEGGMEIASGVASTNAKLIIGTTGDSYSYIQSMQQDYDWSTRPLILQPNGGNVGIGTTNPVEKLSIVGSTAGDQAVISIGASGTTGERGYYRGIDFHSQPTDSNTNYLTAQAYTKWDGGTWGSSRFTINTPSSGGEIFNIKGGNVGIGTITPGFKLQVTQSAGDWTIHANGTGGYGLLGTGSVYAGYFQGPVYASGTVTAPTFSGSLSGNATTATTASNANSVAGLAVHAGRNNEANKIVRTDGSGYLQTGYINSDSGNEGNNSNPPRVWGTNGSDTYLRTYMTSALSVNYAASAGGAFGLGNNGNAISGAGTGSTWDPRPGGNASFAINYHTGVSISGYPGYGGVRLYSAGYPTQASAVLRLEASSAVYTFGGLYSDGNAVIHSGNIASQSVANANTVGGLGTGSFIKWDTWDRGNYYGSDGNIYMGWYGNWMSNIINQSVRTDSSPTFANPHVSDWMSFNGDSASYIGTGAIAGGWGSTANDLAIRSSGSIFFATGGSTSRMKIDASGVTAGAFIYSSDRNLKKNIATIQNPLEKILQLRGVTFDWKADNKPSVGLIAQEVEKVFPELVIGEEGRKGVQYGNLVAPLIEAVKAQQKEISGQDEKINNLNNAISTLNARLKILEVKNNRK